MINNGTGGYPVRLHIRVRSERTVAYMTQDVRLPFVPTKGMCISTGDGDQRRILSVTWSIRDHKFDLTVGPVKDNGFSFEEEVDLLEKQGWDLDSESVTGKWDEDY